MTSRRKRGEQVAEEALGERHRPLAESEEWRVGNDLRPRLVAGVA